MKGVCDRCHKTRDVEHRKTGRFKAVCAPCKTKLERYDRCRERARVRGTLYPMKKGQHKGWPT